MELVFADDQQAAGLQATADMQELGWSDVSVLQVLPARAAPPGRFWTVYMEGSPPTRRGGGTKA